MVRDPKFEETPFWHVYLMSQPLTWDSVIGDNPKQLEIAKGFKDLITGNSPVEYLHQMHNHLVLYVASFEPRQQARKLTEREHISTLYKKLESGGYGTGSATFNSFKDNHPMHSALRELYRDVLLSDMNSFKARRKEIIEYFDPQYQRICNAATEMANFVEKVKADGGMYTQEEEGEFEKRPSEFYYAQVLIEELLNAIVVRDGPLKYKSSLKRCPVTYEFAPGERETREILGPDPDCKRMASPQFLDSFKVAVRGLLGRCREIQKTRADLYKSDIGDTIDPDLFSNLPDVEKLGLDFDVLPRPGSPTPSDRSLYSKTQEDALNYMLECVPKDP